MVGIAVLLSIAALCAATYGMSKLSKHLEKRKVRTWVYVAVMLPLMTGVGYGFCLCISLSNTLSG